MEQEKFGLCQEILYKNKQDLHKNKQDLHKNKECIVMESITFTDIISKISEMIKMAKHDKLFVLQKNDS